EDFRTLGEGYQSRHQRIQRWKNVVISEGDGAAGQAMPEFDAMFAWFASSCVRVALPVALGCTIVGCGATGLDWVDQPETASGWSAPDPHSVANVPMPRSAGASIPATADSEPVPENHQRLNHTVTLGEVDATQSDQPPPGAYGAPPVSVTINNYGAATPAYYGGYGGFGVFRGGGSRGANVTGASRASSSGMSPGQNWPAIADHGTSFPLRAVPAGAGRGQQ
ncbi:MAG TPA: hypothetical protein VK745_26180, partial [Polyangiaceae bacterium]|nr:hypothetical protein [Polyangiaceae bacterium]